MEVHTLIRKVRANIVKGHFELAKKLEIVSETSETEDLEAQDLKAKSLGITNGFEKAQSMFFDLESVWTNNFNLFRMHCNFLREFGNHDDAIALGERILKKFRNHPEAYELQIENHNLAGNVEEAWKICNRAVLKFPDNIVFVTKIDELNSILNDNCSINKAIGKLVG